MKLRTLLRHVELVEAEATGRLNALADLLERIQGEDEGGGDDPPPAPEEPPPDPPAKAQAVPSANGHAGPGIPSVVEIGAPESGTGRGTALYAAIREAMREANPPCPLSFDAGFRACLAREARLLRRSSGPVEPS